jgi:energy-coupling factor transporter ATP-binding protein EcfA2
MFLIVEEWFQQLPISVIVEHKVKHIWNHVDRVILMDYNGNIIADECPEIICVSLLLESQHDLERIPMLVDATHHIH